MKKYFIGIAIGIAIGILSVIIVSDYMAVKSKVLGIERYLLNQKNISSKIPTEKQ